MQNFYLALQFHSDNGWFLRVWYVTFGREINHKNYVCIWYLCDRASLIQLYKQRNICNNNNFINNFNQLNMFREIIKSLLLHLVGYLYYFTYVVYKKKSRRMRWARHVARMGEDMGAYGVFVGKPEGKRPLRRPRRRWVDNIGMDLQEVGCGYVDWIGLVQDRDRWRMLVSAVMKLRVP